MNFRKISFSFFLDGFMNNFVESNCIQSQALSKNI